MLIDAETSAVQRVIVLQYNPDTLSRTLQAQPVGGAEGDRLQPLRLKGPAVETIKIEAEIDAADQLEVPLENPNTVEHGVAPQLAALEVLVNPTSDDLQISHRLAQEGVLEIAPYEAPLALFVWGPRRVLPVRVTDFSITEEAFDPVLNPIRAKVSLGLRVLSVNDLGFEHKGGAVYLAYRRQREALAAMGPAGSIAALGLRNPP